jgi:hypothetical protein
MVNKYINKWDIVFVPKFPENIKCIICQNDFIPYKCNCTICNQETNILYIIPKQPRPVLIWIDQLNWHKSIAFGIPLSSIYKPDLFNVLIKPEECNFLDTTPNIVIARTASISQATRFSANTINITKVFGRLTNSVKQEEINNKLNEWLFRQL